MGPLFGFIGLLGFLFGLVSVVKPMGWLGVATRKTAGWVLAGSFGVFSLGVGVSPPAEGEVTNEAVGTTRPSTETTEATNTTSSSVAATTSTSTTSTSTTLPPIPQAEIVFAEPSAGESGDPSQPLPDGADTATVVSIIDGDTLTVRLSDDTVDTVRLIGTNSPEKGECWDDESVLALSVLVPVGREMGLTGDVTNRDQFDRLLRYLWIGTMSVNEEMVRRGAAIARRYPPDTAMAERFEAAQIAAQASRIGLWDPEACGPAADADVRIADLVYDAPGDDNQNLNGEWVTIRNAGSNLVDLTRWGIKDESASHRYSFPSGFTLAPGESVTVYTGCGDDFGTDLYWCAVGSAIWNNDGDTAFLLDPNGNTHATRSYTPPTTTTTRPATTTTTRPATTTTSSSGGDCHPSYPDVCIPPPPPDLNCGDISHRRFTVSGSDPHGFDGDDDGVGCES